MRIITKPEAMREASRAARATGRTVGLVPTMGALHEGHASLVRRARGECALTVVSLFVNPAQFGPEEDLASYPRPFEADRALLERLECDVLFRPDPADVYPAGYRTWVTVEGVAEGLCGAARPGHFRGVATVVLKLMNMVEPDAAYFGLKDYQQVRVIGTMARDLDLACRIVACPTVREADGLAMSSRNAYLAPEDRAVAPILHRALRAAQEALDGGERGAAALVARARSVIATEPRIALEYLDLVDPEDLTPLTGPVSGRALLAVAARIGGTRLIDNLLLESGT